jgi:hypothetical protein
MNRTARTLATLGVANALLVGWAAAALAQDSTGYFTAEQAQRGAATYNANCSQCHGRNLEGVEAPALSGVDVMGNWGTAQGMYDYFSVAMPANAPGQLGQQAYLDIMAHILQFNGAPAGDKELTLADLPNINLVEATSAGASASSSSSSSSAAASSSAPASNLPQAFTFGKQLPTVSSQSTPPTPSVPQAFTYGKQLPTVSSSSSQPK